MSQPIYLLIIGSGYTEAWYQLSQEEQERVYAEVHAVDERLGAKHIIMCDARWADESTYVWGVLEYPDLETYQQKVAELEKLGWWRYFSAKTILGTKMEQSGA